MSSSLSCKPVDTSGRLWLVENIIDAVLLQKIQQHDWTNAPASISQPQPGWTRKKVDVQSVPLLQQLDTALRQAVSKLEEKTGLYFSYYYNDFWLDPPGWRVPLHTDSFIYSSLQIYWLGEPGTGTSFYHTKNLADLRYQFDFVPNTGYLMLNMIEHGVQPLQWHAMTVPTTQYRFSSYTRLGPYYQR